MDNEEIKQVIGQRVKYYRNTKSLTQRELAVKIGVAPSYIASIENGHKGISLEKIVELCMWFNISASDLLPLKTCLEADEKEFVIRNIANSLRTWEIEKIKLLEAMVVYAQVPPVGSAPLAFKKRKAVNE